MKFSKPAQLKRRGKITPNYYVRVYNHGRQTTVTTGCSNLEEAERWVARQVANGVECGFSIRFKAAIEKWLKEKRSQVSGARFQITEYYAMRWLGELRGSYLRGVSRDRLRFYFSERSKEVKAVTLNDEMVRMKSFFKWCVDSEYLEKSPAALLKPLKTTPRKKTGFLTKQEEGALLEACGDPELRCLVEVALRTGFRRGTLMELTWGMVVRDDLGYRWRIPGELVKTDDEILVAAHPEAVRALEDFREILVASGVPATRVGKDAKVFSVSKGVASKKFGQARRKCGLDNLRFHDLRGIFIDRLCEAGVTIDEAMTFTLHKSLATVYRHYRGRLSRDAQIQAMSKLS